MDFALARGNPGPNFVAVVSRAWVHLSQLQVEYVKHHVEEVKHHVEEEQAEMFTKAKASSADMVDLGARMAARKDELLAQVA